MSTAVQAKRDPDETVDLKTLIAEVVADPEVWMDTPHDLLGGKKPNELVGTANEQQLRELARAIKIGMFS
jgi:hypothetical protein